MFTKLPLFPIAFLATALAAAEPAGQVLLLENEQLIEGVIARKGEWYSIKRATGETIYPAEKVWKVVPDRKAAYAAVHGRANLDDVDERVRLAKWCMQYDLREEALLEAEAGLKIKPNEAYCAFVVQSLKKPAAITPAEKPAEQPKPAMAVQTDIPGDFPAEALGTFTSRVQPILMNACASCHASGKAGAFVLEMNHGNASRRATQMNVIAAIKMIDRTNPMKSPLLEKGLVPHGDGKAPPLKGKASPAYQHLEAWVSDYFPQLAKKETPVVEDAEPKVVSKAIAKTETKEEPKAASKPPVVIDPFDPKEFNEKFGAKKEDVKKKD